MEKRIGVVGIVIENPEENANKVQNILSQYSNIIYGRMGIPFKDKGLGVISLIVEGTNDEIGALSGKLGRINGVTVKATLTSKKIED
ncbi:TM1266 family iron-only hydrogenase system putative regulator [Caldicellulosiruptoraceae bacterium PP1]